MSSLLRGGLALVSAFFCVGANASDWRLIQNITDGLLYMDYDSVAPREGIVKAWFMSTYETEKTLSAYPSKKYKSLKQLNYFNCLEKSSLIVQTVYYSDELGIGDSVDSSAINPSKAIYIDVIPDTVGEGMLQAACSRVRPQPATTNPRAKGAVSKR